MVIVKRAIIYFIKIACAGVVSLFLLSVITIIYNLSGVHISNESGATDYKWEPEQLKTTMKEGFSWFRMDKNGFNNSYPSRDNIDILLMGSSHMEAVNINRDENIGYRLNELLPDFYTYNIGISGHSIYACVNNLHNAVKFYSPKKYVIIETDTVELNMDQMKNVINADYERIPSYDSGVLYWIQKKIPAVKAVYNQVDEWRNYSVDTNAEEMKENIPSEEYSQILSEFLDKAVEAVKSNDNKLIIFYHPETKIGEGGLFKDSTNKSFLRIFNELCFEKEICFIDLTEEFKELYETEHVLAHGFINTAVGEGHLNRYGHEVIAKTLVAEINDWEGRK